MGTDTEGERREVIEGKGGTRMEGGDEVSGKAEDERGARRGGGEGRRGRETMEGGK